MNDYRYIPIEPVRNRQSYVFRVVLTHTDDGRWYAWVESLPGCVAWGYSRDEALNAIRYVSHAYIAMLLRKGVRVSYDIEVLDTPVVVVTV